MKSNKKVTGKRKPATSRKRPRSRNIDPLGPDILWKYPGKFIVYSEDEQRVIGVGDTEKQAYEQAHASGVGGLWHSAYAPRPDELYV